MEKKSSFLFDRMLGGLCRKMRLLGYDAELNPEGDTGRFLSKAKRERRVPVTRSMRHHDRPGPPPIILKAEKIEEQIAELFVSIGERPRFEPFARCLECNAELAAEEASAVKGEVPAYIEKHFDRYRRCPECRRIYWEGSHYEAMREEIERISRLLDEH